MFKTSSSSWSETDSVDVYSLQVLRHLWCHRHVGFSGRTRIYHKKRETSKEQTWRRRARNYSLSMKRLCTQEPSLSAPPRGPRFWGRELIFSRPLHVVERRPLIHTLVSSSDLSAEDINNYSKTSATSSRLYAKVMISLSALVKHVDEENMNDDKAACWLAHQTRVYTQSRRLVYQQNICLYGNKNKCLKAIKTLFRRTENTMTRREKSVLLARNTVVYTQSLPVRVGICALLTDA